MKNKERLDAIKITILGMPGSGKNIIADRIFEALQGLYSVEVFEGDDSLPHKTTAGQFADNDFQYIAITTTNHSSLITNRHEQH